MPNTASVSNYALTPAITRSTALRYCLFHPAFRLFFPLLSALIPTGWVSPAVAVGSRDHTPKVLASTFSRRLTFLNLRHSSIDVPLSLSLSLPSYTITSIPSQSTNPHNSITQPSPFPLFTTLPPLSHRHQYVSPPYTRADASLPRPCPTRPPHSTPSTIDLPPSPIPLSSIISSSRSCINSVLTLAVGKSHKFNDRDHAGIADGTAHPTEYVPRYFAKSGHVDTDPKKTKKNGAGKGGWGVNGEEVQDEGFNLTNARRRSNSSSYAAGLKDFKTKFEAVETEPVFEEDLHGPGSADYSEEEPLAETRRVTTTESSESSNDDAKSA